MADGDPTLVTQIQSETTQAQANDRATDPEDHGGINPRTAEAKLHHIEATTATAIGQGFQFSPDEVQLQLNHCQELLIELQDDLRRARQARMAVHSPAPDTASVTQADAVRNMLENTANVIESNIAYVADWQNRLNAAKQNYMTTEHLNEQQWTRLSQGLQA